MGRDKQPSLQRLLIEVCGEGPGETGSRCAPHILGHGRAAEP